MSTRLLLTFLLPLALGACGGREPNAPAAAAAATADGRRDDVVLLTPEQIATGGIELAEAGPARVRETLQLYGVIAPNAERMRNVAARYAGVIRSINKKVGDTVKQGEELAVVESNESLQAYAVTAPLSGVITARNANPGEQAGDRTLLTVADLSTVWVELSLFPRDVPRVRVGQRVQIKSTDTDQSANGEVIYVAPFGQSMNQTLTARVQLDNTDRRWAPGLYVTADVVTAETEVPVAVAKTAVQTIGERPVVFVATRDGFVRRSVRLGRDDGAVAEVLDGIAAGERYAAANSYVLKAEALKNEAAED
jgi:cobalt-zinc-cadmium efflux system membrane fusion protein